MDPTTPAAVDTREGTAEKKISLFIIDDDKFLLDIYAQKFSKNNLDVHTADNAENALKQIRGGIIPDILLVDVIMPGLTGLEMLEALRKENLAPNATIIMLTNQSSNEDLTNAKRFNIDGYIVKAMAIPSEVLAEVLKIHAAHLVKK